MNAMRAQRSFVERYPFDYSEYPWKRVADTTMMRAPDSLEHSCFLIREFLATMNRPLNRGVLRNHDEVKFVLSTHDRPWLGVSQSSPNGRLLFTYKYFPTSGKFRVERQMFLNLKNIDQIHLVTHSFEAPRGFASVDGIKRFHSNLDHPLSPRQWFYATSSHVCFALHADCLDFGDMTIYNSIYLIAPKVRR